MASFQQVVTQLANHIRNPAIESGPTGIEDRRLKIYRELFYNNIEGFVSGAFPIFRGLVDDDTWHAMIRDFMVQYRCHTPYFLEISQEFQQYLSTQSTFVQMGRLPAFAVELVHYEWVELALDVNVADIEEFEALNKVDRHADLLAGLPVVSPLAWSLAYQYPVHLIGQDLQPESPPEQPTYLIVYRNRDDHVGFMEANAVTARLLALLEEIHSRDDTNVKETGRSVLLTLAAEMQHPQPQQIVDSGLTILQQLQGLDIILGANG